MRNFLGSLRSLWNRTIPGTPERSRPRPRVMRPTFDTLEARVTPAAYTTDTTADLALAGANAAATRANPDLGAPEGRGAAAAEPAAAAAAGSISGPAPALGAGRFSILGEDFEATGSQLPGSPNRPLPAGWTTINQDGRAPSTAVSYVQDAWIVREDFGQNAANHAAFSTSWYNPAGAADDWLITPALTLGANAQLDWRSIAYDPAYPDGYEVRIGASPTVAGLSTVLFSTPAENSAWTPHAVDLSAYDNQTVYIAFRNNSNDKFLLLTDDITVTSEDPADTAPPDTTVTGNPPAFDDASATFAFTGTDDVTPAANLTYEYSLDGGTFATAASGMTLNNLPDGSHTFEVRAVDAAGNVDPTPASYTWVVDTVATTVAVGAPSQAYANAAATVTFDVTYADANPLSFSLDPTDIQVNPTGGASANVQSVVQTANPNVWTVTLNTITGNGTIGITVKSGTASDGAENTAGASPASATFTVDTIKPTVTFAAPNVTTTKGGPVTFKVTAADANLATPFTLTAGQVQFVSVTGTLTADLTVAAGPGANTWTVTVKNIRGKGSFKLQLPAGVAADKAGNASDAPPDSATVAVSGVRKMTLAVTKPATVKRGGRYTYAISYANTGTQQLDGVSLTATLPAGATFDPAKSTAGWMDIGGGKYRFDVGTVAVKGKGKALFAVVMPTVIPPTRKETLTAAVYDALSGEKPLATRTVTSSYGRYA
jgi:uncharacterized repeat protein (TIGR01451 family)